jgi:putative MATE family efflux protein
MMPNLSFFSSDTKKVLALAIPAGLKHLVDILQILIDMIMVGTVSVYALAAVGMSMQFMMVVNLFMTLYVVGGNALISRFIGEGRRRRASALLFSLLLVAIALALVVSLPFYFFSYDFYALMGASPEVALAGGIYMKILAMGFVVIFVDTLIYNALSASGDTKSSLYVKLFSALLNATLNYIFIFGHFGFEAMGIAGAGYATLIAYSFNLVAYMFILKKDSATLHIIRLIRLADIKRVIKVGWSAALERGISSLSFLLFVAIIANYGTAQLAGYQAGLRIEGIAFMPGFGFAIASMALVGQSLGAKKLDEAYKMGIISAKIASLFMGTIGLFLIFFGEFFVSFFTQDSATIEVAKTYLFFVGLAQIPLALNFVFSASLRGAGATKTTLKVNVASLWFFRVIPSFIVYKLGYGVVAVFIIMNIETLIKGSIYYYIYKQRVWLDTKV